MRNHIGYTIKFHRKRKNMTQNELAKGIISISYLSKIENGLAQPPEDTIESLFKRLNLELSFQSNDEQLKNLCKTWFVSLFNKNMEETELLFSQIEEIIEWIVDNNLLNLVEIHKLRYYLNHNKNEEANNQLQLLSKVANSFNNNQMYYWLKFTGNYYFNNSFYNKALNQYQQAEEYVKHANYLEEEEESDLYYMTALTASYVRKTYLVYKYANQALDYYQKKVHLKHAAQCHILLGITSVRIHDYDDALESFTLAEKIAKKINDKKLYTTVLQNIGNLYTSLSDTDQAISYYKQSYKLRNDIHKKLIPISSLIKEYYKIKDLNNANFWLQRGLKLTDDINTNTLCLYEIKVYDYLINGEDNQNIEKLILNEVIPFINYTEQEYQKVPFLDLLANYYFENHKYKLAATYYKQALAIKSSKY